VKTGVGTARPRVLSFGQLTSGTSRPHPILESALADGRHQGEIRERAQEEVFVRSRKGNALSRRAVPGGRYATLFVFICVHSESAKQSLVGSS
jgi:hypothetical protein